MGLRHVIKRYVHLMLVLGCFLFGPLAMGFDSPYDEKAPSLLPTKHFVVKKQGQGLQYPLDVWTPQQPGTYPVFFFLTGLNGLAPNQAYDMTWQKLAARGVIVISPTVGLVSPLATKKLAYEFVQSITWMQYNLPRAFQEHGASARPQMENLVISGHSSGAKAIIELYRIMRRDIAGLVLVDPVDKDPVNMSEPTIGEDDYFSFGTPLLVIGSGLGNQPGRNWGKFWPACAPDDTSADFFYKHFAGPKWKVKALDYGHADMLERIFLATLQKTRFCKVADHLDPEPFRSFLAGSIAAFMKSQFAKKAEYLPYIEDASLVPIAAHAEFE